MSGYSSTPPLVSIVLPTYKRAHLLPHAIRSVLHQTHGNLELIIVDDNSPDGTAEVVNSFDDGRIRYTRNDSNLKLPRSLNKGFSLAKGAFLTWTSDDNFFSDDAIEKMVDTLLTGNCDLVYADYFLFADIDQRGSALETYHEHLPGKLQLEKGNHIGACFLYTRKAYETVGEYDQDLFLVEDYDYFMRIAKQFEVCHIPEPLYYFRRHDDALYCSRYCEVKAADVLVRYKNGFINEDTALHAVVSLLLQGIDKINNPFLRFSRRFVKGVSYRLTNAHRKLCEIYLLQRLRPQVFSALTGYRDGKATFWEAKEEMMKLILNSGTIEYIQPTFPRQSSSSAAES